HMVGDSWIVGLLLVVVGHPLVLVEIEAGPQFAGCRLKAAQAVASLCHLEGMSGALPACIGTEDFLADHLAGQSAQSRLVITWIETGRVVETMCRNGSLAGVAPVGIGGEAARPVRGPRVKPSAHAGRCRGSRELP